jgi:hypothetical protein
LSDPEILPRSREAGPGRPALLGGPGIGGGMGQMSIQIVMMLPPEAASVSLARHTLAGALRVADVTAECSDEAQVALSEACTNVFEHAAAGPEL